MGALAMLRCVLCLAWQSVLVELGIGYDDVTLAWQTVLHVVQLYLSCDGVWLATLSIATKCSSCISPSWEGAQAAWRSRGVHAH